MATSVFHPLTPFQGSSEELRAAEKASPPPPARVEAAAVDEMIPAVYEELRRLAGAYLRGEWAEETLQPTALVHEAYLTLLAQRRFDWNSPGHFVGIFARLMRQTLKNRAVAKSSLKRGGADRMGVILEYYETQQVDVSAVDLALDELEKQDERQARIVELRFFGGLTVEEIAQVLSISPATVKRDWTIAKMWLRRELAKK